MDWEERIGRRVTLRDLRILLTAIEAGSVSKAAARLSVSQPAISKSIAQLERALGAKLVKRTSRGVSPTPEGEALAARGRAAFGELRASVEAMDESAAPQGGVLRISGNQVSLSGIIPAVVNNIYARHPRVTFDVVQSHTFADQVRLLENEAVELVVARIALPMPLENLALVELFRDDFVIVAGPSARWARRRKIALAELVDQPWTFPPTETVTGAAMAAIFRANGLEAPRLSVAASSLQLHQRLVMESDFLTFFPLSMARAIPGIRVLPVALDMPPQSVGILTLKYRTPSPLAKLFIREAEIASREFQQT